MVWIWLFGMLFEVNAAAYKMFIEYEYLKEDYSESYIKDEIAESVFFNIFFAIIPIVNIFVGVFVLLSVYAIKKKGTPFANPFDILEDFTGRMVNKIITIFEHILEKQEKKNNDK